MAKRALFLFVLLLLAPAARAQSVGEITSAIAKRANGSERRLAITKQLDSAHVAYTLEDFVDARMRMGTNIVVTLPNSSSKTILIGAHSDRVAVGQGALDNAASCAVLLKLVEAFKAKPLPNATLKFVFFDLEEGGLGGSRAFFEAMRARQEPLPTYGVNLDIFGYGDTIFAAASNASGVLAKALQQAGMETGIPVRMATPAEYPASDHRNMMAAGIEALGLALIDGKEIDAVVSLSSPTPAATPRILTLIHTPNDTMEAVRADQIEKGVPLVERLLRLAPF